MRGQAEPSGITSGRGSEACVQGHPDLPSGGGGRSSIVGVKVIGLFQISAGYAGRFLPEWIKARGFAAALGQSESYGLRAFELRLTGQPGIP